MRVWGKMQVSEVIGGLCQRVQEYSHDPYLKFPSKRASEDYFE